MWAEVCGGGRQWRVQTVLRFCVCSQAEGDEVTLRRTFGAAKDQYFLNRKPINKVCVLAVAAAAWSVRR